MPENTYESHAPMGTSGVELDDGEYKSPENVIPSAAAAYTVYEQLRRDHIKRAAVFAKIQGMIDGNPPYPRSAMKRGGLQSASNVNWRDGESIYESVALAFWSLFNDVEHIVRFDTDLGNPYELARIGDIVSEEFDVIIRRGWKGFLSRMSQHQSDLVKFGTSIVFWPDEKDWRFDIADIWTTLFPEKSKNEVDDISIIAFEHTMTAQELWRIYESSDATHWNKEALGDILLWESNYRSNREYSDIGIVDLQKRIRSNDVSIDSIYNDDIRLIQMLITEYDGEVSRGIFHPDLHAVTARNGSDGGPSPDWPYFFDRQYGSMGQAALPFTFTPGERHLHANKGVGHKIFSTVEGITHIDNSVMDAARRAGTVLLRSRATRGKDPQSVQFVHGGFVNIGEMEFVQNLMGSNIASNVDAARYFQTKLERNNAISGTSMSTPDGKPRTLGEIQVQVTKEARVQKNRIAHYYEQLDSLFQEVVRKMLLSKENHPGHELVKIWKDKCLARGVPEEFFVLNEDNKGLHGLPQHLTVSVTRASGSGSQFADQVEMQSMMNILPTAGERGRRAILMDYVAAHRGHRYIARYYPPEDQTQQPTGDDTIASIENNQLEKGEMVVVSPDNNHAIHAPRHLQRMEQIAQAFNEAVQAARGVASRTPEADAGNFGQYSLEETDVAFQTLGPHFIRHLLYLQQDPTRRELAQSLAAKWRILANFGDKVAHNAQEHRQKKLRDLQDQQEQMDQMDSDERVKMRKVEIEGNIKMQKLIADIQRAATRDSLQYILERSKVSFENELKRAKAEGELAIQAGKAERERLAAGARGDETTGKRGTELF